MSLTIGRVGVDFTLRNPSAQQVSGSSYQFSGTAVCGTEAQARVFRNQLIGLTQASDPVVPVVASWDSFLDGWYQITNASCTPEPGYWERGVVKWSVTGERIGGSSACMTESYILETSRSTGHAVTADPWWAISDQTTGFSDATSGTAYTTRSGPGGAVRFWQDSAYETAATWRYNLAPADWYDMAPYIKVGGYYVTGLAAENATSDWEIGNGLFKITPGTGGLLAFTAPSSDASAWGTASHWKVGWYFVSTIYSVTTVDRVLPLLVSPNCCVLRLACSFAPGSGLDSHLFLDITVNRGDRSARLVLDSDLVFQWGLKPVATTAATALTGGLYQSSNDSDGNQWLLVSSLPVTTSTGSGWVYTTSSTTSADYCLGAAYTGSAASGNETAANLRDQYFELISESQQVFVG